MATGKRASKTVKTPAAAEPIVEVDREDAIRRAAYAAAERRNFEPGFETQDWLAAEQEYDKALADQRGGEKT